MSATAAPAPAATAIDLYGDTAMERSGSDDDDAAAAGSFAMEREMPRRPPAASSKPPSAELLREESLHDDESAPVAAASTALLESMDSGACCQCGRPMGGVKGATTRNGPLHPSCIAEYKFLHQPRCHYCNIRFRDSEVNTFVKDSETGHLYHPDCHASEQAGRAYVRPTLEGSVRKYAIARSRLSLHNWKARFFVLSPANGGIRYYADKAAASAGATRRGSDAKSDDGGASYDADADPDRDATEARRAKGVVPLDKRSRLLTRPSLSNYRPSSSAASDNDIGIIFFGSPESQTELRLIFQCATVAERNEWIAALQAYIYTVDDPADYPAAAAAAAPPAVGAAAAAAKTEKKDEKKKK
ncbi:hypothetical protein NESM_000567700 [Novymonas esmeraldas]|uniref:PH domain-containing protein n=1 Tax=Novymonas esmeraldas TaxID=1808958 RepID=A0AAW0ET28_9TRYP